MHTLVMSTFRKTPNRESGHLIHTCSMLQNVLGKKKSTLFDPWSVSASRDLRWILNICSRFWSSYRSYRRLRAWLSCNHRLKIIQKENVVCIPPLIPRYACQPTTVDGSVPYRTLEYQLSVWSQFHIPGFILVTHKPYFNNLVTFHYKEHILRID